MSEEKIIAHPNSAEEIEAAIAEARDASGGYTHTFKKPFLYQDKEYTVLHFDFESLTGNDLLAIERELNITQNINIVSPALSGPFLYSMAARAASISTDAIYAMPIRDANRIRSKARDFLLLSEQ